VDEESQRQNRGNARVQQRPKSSVFKGVCWNKTVGKWQAQLKRTAAGKKHLKYLGIFTEKKQQKRGMKPLLNTLAANIHF